MSLQKNSTSLILRTTEREERTPLIDVETTDHRLECTAELKCSKNVSREVKKTRVEEVMKELGIAAIADVRVGGIGAAKSLSGGERKRVNIAVSLLTRPAVCFLDEPTTGLDSATADDVLAVVAGLARQDRAMAATLHAPSSKAFRLSVDKVLVLGKGGKVVYSGSPGKGPLLAHLDKIGGPDFVEGDSLADHMMAIFGGGVASADDLKTVSERAAQWLKSEQGMKEQHRLSKLSLKDTSNEDAAGKVMSAAAKGSLAWDEKDPRRNFSVATGAFHGVRTLIQYRSLHSYKDPEYIAARLGDKVMYGFTLATLWWGEASRQRREPAIQNTAGL